MKKNYIRVFILLFSFITITTFAQNFQWVSTSSENTGMYNANNIGKCINSDALGNVYVIGTFNDSIFFGDYSVKSFGQATAFIVKYSPAGEALWADRFGTTYAWGTDAIANDAAVTDAEGNTYILLAMLYKGAIGGTEYPAGYYLIKYDTGGNIVWVKNGLPAGAAKLFSDSEDNLIIYSAGFKMTKYSKDGTEISNFADNIGYNAVYSAAVDQSGNSYFTGTCIISPSNLGGNTIEVGKYFLAKYNSLGEFQWVKTSSGDGVETGSLVQVCSDGSVVVVGTQVKDFISATDATFDEIEIKDSKSFFLKYDSDGNIQWGQKIVATSNDMVSDWKGNIYVAGWYQLTGYFGADSLTGDNTGLGNAFIAKYNSSGDVVWLTQIDGYHTQKVWGMTLDKSNDLLLTGQYYLGANFGTDTLHQEATIGAYNFIFTTKISSGTVSGIENLTEGEIPTTLHLAQNYPNPFNPVTTINYYLPNQSNVKLSIYSALGEELVELINSVTPAGYHSIEFNADNLASGIYYYEMRTEDFREIKKMVLLR